MEELEGIVEKITYHNKDNFFTVVKLSDKITNDEVTAIGYFPSLEVGEILKLKGKWSLHRDYGYQFKIDFYEKVMPSTTRDIENYLASGVIRGIGPVTAKKIVDAFGDKSLEVIEHSPDKLLSIDGIGEKKLKTIAKSYEEQRETRKIMIFLQKYGIGPGIATRIYKRYKESAIEVLEENPYRLADEVYGIGFKTADKIAMGMGIEKDSIERLSAGLKYTLYRAADRGHIFLPEEKLLMDAAKLLKADINLLNQALLALKEREDVITEERWGKDIYLAPFYVSEQSVARRLFLLTSLSAKPIDINQSDISELEKITKTQLAKEQKKAIMMAASSGVLVITGGPGTGKTTVINSLIHFFEKHDLKIALAAPTGRAAKRMAETTGREAKTIHRLLEYKAYEGQGMVFGKNIDDPLDEDVIIIDETSMVDLLLMHHLLAAIVPGTRLILVGDKDQLPSVGPGSVLKEILESAQIPKVTLTKIFRQAKESLIVVNAHRINQGYFPYLNVKDKDFFFEQVINPEEILDRILKLVKQQLPSSKNLNPLEDIQILSPMRKGILGVENLNCQLQEILNPEDITKKQINFRTTVFREGDKIMQIKNNYDKEVYNGDIGFIDEIDIEEGELAVVFPESHGERTVIYGTEELEELNLAYALSVHKSQGSEFPAVIMPITNQHYIMLRRNLVYTAITRAKKLMVLVGAKQALTIAVQNNRDQRRFGHLSHRLTEEFSSLI